MMMIVDDVTFSFVSNHDGRDAVDHDHDDVHDHCWYFVDDVFLQVLESAPPTFLRLLLPA